MSKVHIDLNGKTILITGAAGFIGAALTQRILSTCEGTCVIGLDNVNDYYDPKLKEYRLYANERAQAAGRCSYKFVKGSIADKALIDKLFREYHPEIVVNLAAQAGVRHSIDHPEVVYREQHHRLLQYPGGLSPQSRGASGVCQQ